VPCSHNPRRLVYLAFFDGKKKKKKKNFAAARNLRFEFPMPWGPPPPPPSVLTLRQILPRHSSKSSASWSISGRPAHFCPETFFSRCGAFDGPKPAITNSGHGPPLLGPTSINAGRARLVDAFKQRNKKKKKNKNKNPSTR